mmetsp:Transcript_74205/g.239987  ORF Transcript_74205/g.239987 Transcript_74205/m.239987 type:complete len:259 (-) Transcript_74205:1320-2096(-)
MQEMSWHAEWAPETTRCGHKRSGRGRLLGLFRPAGAQLCGHLQVGLLNDLEHMQKVPTIGEGQDECRGDGDAAADALRGRRHRLAQALEHRLLLGAHDARGLQGALPELRLAQDPGDGITQLARGPELVDLDAGGPVLADHSGPIVLVHVVGHADHGNAAGQGLHRAVGAVVADEAPHAVALQHVSLRHEALDVPLITVQLLGQQAVQLLRQGPEHAPVPAVERLHHPPDDLRVRPYDAAEGDVDYGLGPISLVEPLE